MKDSTITVKGDWGNGCGSNEKPTKGVNGNLHGSSIREEGSLVIGNTGFYVVMVASCVVVMAVDLAPLLGTRHNSQIFPKALQEVQLLDHLFHTFFLRFCCEDFRFLGRSSSSSSIFTASSRQLSFYLQVFVFTCCSKAFSSSFKFSKELFWLQVLPKHKKFLEILTVVSEVGDIRQDCDTSL
ncbi:hypothetical protein Tco_1352799 [Tanacetum coccineum]